MNLRFTKMQGAGNDFVVIDATRSPLALTTEQSRHLGDRRFGVGADQILIVEAAPSPAVDFRYRIFNSSGEEVEHCGNGARCFLRFVRAKGLTTQRLVRVQTMNRVLELREGDDGRVTVDMGAPVFDLDAVPFDAQGLQSVPGATPGFPLWPLALPGGSTVDVAVLSMGNPHAVQRVDDVDTAPVAAVGPLVERHVRFPQRVNASFLQVLSRSEVRLRVFERGAGETLACGTGACAAVVAGIRLGWLDACVEVQALGGRLTIEWAGAQRLDAPVLLTGPAEFVFEGEIEL
ncbi:MAG: diaminopimelate epimerase [Betaproteobacteria bacterium]